MSTSPSSTTSNFSLVTTGTGSTRPAPSPPKMRAAISVARSTSKPSMSPVVVLREENPNVFSSRPTRSRPCSRISSSALSSAASPNLASFGLKLLVSRSSRVRTWLCCRFDVDPLGSATVVSVTGSGKGVEHLCDVRPSRLRTRNSEHRQEEAGKGRRTHQRNSRSLGCSPITTATPAAIAVRTTRMGSTNAKLPRPIGVVAQCRRRALDQLGQLRVHGLCGVSPHGRWRRRRRRDIRRP